MLRGKLTPPDASWTTNAGMESIQSVVTHTSSSPMVTPVRRDGRLVFS